MKKILIIDDEADLRKLLTEEKAETPVFNNRNMETVMMLLVVGTVLWGGYAIFRINRSKKRITAGRLIISSVGRLLPVLIFLFLPQLASFIVAGRVLPWLGLWTTMSSLIIWLAVLSLVNITNLVCRYRLYFQSR
ncbi:hypothetical protein [Paenibacillus sp. FSL H8-0537]|uniref:hypothetical protein n=1 Tax=Paenibacillus sp. FSL H8-0537 TaxID=2921399 RepID=UPI00310120BB